MSDDSSERIHEVPNGPEIPERTKAALVALLKAAEADDFNFMEVDIIPLEDEDDSLGLFFNGHQENCPDCRAIEISRKAIQN